MSRIISIVKTKICNDKQSGCNECKNSCQSACKTSCTVGNQSCENKRIKKDILAK